MTLDYAPLQRDLADVGYIADDALAMALCLMIGLGRPLLLEGEAGVGKTEIGKALAQVLKTRLIRLQCYEGLDANATIYEWNYQRQLLAIRAHERDAMPSDAIERHIFSKDYLLQRPPQPDHQTKRHCQRVVGDIANIGEVSLQRRVVERHLGSARRAQPAHPRFNRLPAASRCRAPA